jgi:hypothetical protein
MMMALGCIQALECNRNTCPVGVTSNDPHLMRSLDVGDKKVRVASFHQRTVHAFVELLAASGYRDHKSINRSDVYRRVEMNISQRYDEIYPYVAKGCMLDYNTCPNAYKGDLAVATASSFKPTFEEAFEA